MEKEGKTMTITVYQMSKEAIEKTGAFPMFYGKDGLFDLDKNIEHYEKVATLDVDTLDEAFEVGNIGPESKYTRFKPMHSISVGDILVKEDCTAYVVADFGFDEVMTDIHYSDCGV